MADNVAVTPGSGATIATDDVGGVQYQRVKLDIGGDGVSSPVTSGNGLPVSIDTAAASGGPANVSGSATSVTLIASNANRKGFSIYNDSSADLYVKFGATASATSFHLKMNPGGYYESPAGFNYTGVIDGIWSSAAGAARVGEFA